MSKVTKVIVELLGLFILVIAVFCAVYAISFHDESYVPDIPVEEEVLDYVLSIEQNGKIYTVEEFMEVFDENNIVVNAILTYSDGTEESIKSYVVYNTDETITNVIFTREKYGKVILPNIKEGC